MFLIWVKTQPSVAPESTLQKEFIEVYTRNKAVLMMLSGEPFPEGFLHETTRLDLYSHQITDISPLASLTNLKTLYLDHNQITDISPLAALTNLTNLVLSGNQITDISPLAALTNLVTLFLDNNQITDISPLASLTNLTYLRLYNNKITDISPLATLLSLSDLYIGDSMDFIAKRVSCVKRWV